MGSQTHLQGRRFASHCANAASKGLVYTVDGNVRHFIAAPLTVYSRLLSSCDWIRVVRPPRVRSRRQLIVKGNDHPPFDASSLRGYGSSRCKSLPSCPGSLPASFTVRQTRSFAIAVVRPRCLDRFPSRQIARGFEHGKPIGSFLGSIGGKPRIDPDGFPFVSDRLERRTETRNEREAVRFDVGFAAEILLSNRRCDGNRCRDVSTDVEDGRWEGGVSKPRASGWAPESVTSKATRKSADRTEARTFDVGSVGVSSPGGVSSRLSDIDDPRSR